MSTKNLIFIFLISTKHDLLSFQIVVSKFKGLKKRHFNGSPRVALTLSTPL